MTANFFLSKVTGNCLLEDCGNFLLSPVYSLFNARHVYKMNNCYFVAEKDKKNCTFLTTLKIILLTPLIPIISLGIILKGLSKFNATVAKTYAIIKDYDNKILKAHKFCTTIKFGTINFIGAQSNLYADFFMMNSFTKWLNINKLKDFISDARELDLTEFDEFAFSVLLTTKKMLKLEKVTLGKHSDVCNVMNFLFQYAPNLDKIILTPMSKNIPLNWIKIHSKNLPKIKNLNFKNIAVSSLDYEALEAFFNTKMLLEIDHKTHLLEGLWPIRSMGIRRCNLTEFSSSFFTPENMTSIEKSLSNVDQLIVHQSFNDETLRKLFTENKDFTTIDISHSKLSITSLDLLAQKCVNLKEIIIGELSEEDLNQFQQKFPHIKCMRISL